MTAFLHGESADTNCILCGRCLDVCPLFAATAREELSPRAKQQLAAAWRKGRLELPEVKELAALCLGCGRCEAACPQGLCAPDLVAGMRAAHPGLQEWLWRAWMRNGGALWPAATRLAGLLPQYGRVRQLQAMRPSLALEPWLAVEKGEAGLAQGPAVLFPGCMATTVRRDWMRKASLLLELQGVTEGAQPTWACCGCTLGHAGLEREQREARECNLHVWRQAGRPRVAVFCATCLCGLRAYGRDTSLPWEPGEAQLWQQAVAPLSSMLDSLQFRVLDAAPDRVAWHTPCHGSERKPGKGADLALLEQAAGERLLLPDEFRCCGMGGIMQLGAPELTRAVAGRCWEALGAAQQVLTGCSGCVAQLAATAPEGVAAGHWLDAVAL